MATRKPAASAAASTQNGAAADPEPQGKQADPKPVVPELPEATYDAGEYQLTYRKPVVTTADGTKLTCPHTTWGHGDERSAKACGRKLAAAAGVRIA